MPKKQSYLIRVDAETHAEFMKAKKMLEKHDSRVLGTKHSYTGNTVVWWLLRHGMEFLTQHADDVGEDLGSFLDSVTLTGYRDVAP